MTIEELIFGQHAGAQLATRDAARLTPEDQAAVLTRGKATRDEMLRQAVAKAAALQAREGQTSVIDSEVGMPTHATTTQDLAEVPEGASDDLAAAVGDRRLKTRQDEAALEKTGSSTELNIMKALLASGAVTPAMLAKLQGAKDVAEIGAGARVDSATIGADARRDVATTGAGAKKYVADHKAPPKPKEMWLRDAEGNNVYGDPHAVPGAQPKLGAATENQARAARITERLGAEVFKQIDEAGPAIGALTGKKEFVLAELGVGDPRVRKLVGTITGLAGSHLRLLSSRGISIQHEIQKMLTTTQTVDSLKATLEGLLSLSKETDEELNGGSSMPEAGKKTRIKFNPTTGDFE